MIRKTFSKLNLIQDELFKIFRETPLKLIKFSAILKSIFKKLSVDEGLKNEVLILLCKGLTFNKSFRKIPKLEQLIIEYESSNEPLLDYAKCFFAKALSNFFNEKISKYKNEAARKIFLRDLSDLTDILHSIPVEKLLTKIESLQFNEKTSVIFMDFINELKTLIDKKWNPDLEVERKINEAQKEIEFYLSKMENLSGFKLGSIGNYQEGLLIHCFFDPWYNDNSSLWGVSFYPILNILNLQPPYIFFDALRRGLLAREAAHFFTPNIIEKMERVYEQMDYCAYKILNDFEAEFWEFARHGLREESKEFDGINYYLEWEAIVGWDFLNKVFSRLKSINRFKSEINFSEYQSIVDSLALKPKHVSLTQEELSILNFLSEKPLISVSELSQKTGVSLPTVQKLLKTLRLKANIWPSVLVDLNKLNITCFLTLLKIKPHVLNELINIIWLFPYCGRIYKVFGETNLLCYFQIPLSYENFIYDYLTILKRADVIEKSFIFKVEEFYYNFNPRFYNASISDWDVPWDEWGLWLKEYLLTKGLLHVIKGRPKEGKRKIKVNKIDLELIRLLRVNARFPFSEIGFKLGVSGAYIGQRVRHLINSQVITPTVASFRIGLDEAVFVTFDCEEEDLTAIKSAFDELPMWQGFKISGDMEGVASMIYIPTGETQELLYAIDKYLIESKLVNKYMIHVIERWTGMRRWLPIELYTDGAGWIFDKNEYLNQLKDEVESLTNKS
ncbi:winged helix-turn-helix transcriptional regulator [Candidatus Bathyarchaeota archaeon]|nr:winged helix-turn-helix transcriptional regulator [Candidatus Bathyarchaeota archaeon]